MRWRVGGVELLGWESLVRNRLSGFLLTESMRPMLTNSVKAPRPPPPATQFTPQPNANPNLNPTTPTTITTTPQPQRTPHPHPTTRTPTPTPDSPKRGQADPVAYIMLRGKAMGNKVGDMVELMTDVLTTARLDDKVRRGGGGLIMSHRCGVGVRVGAGVGVGGGAAVSWVFQCTAEGAPQQLQKQEERQHPHPPPPHRESHHRKPHHRKSHHRKPHHRKSHHRKSPHRKSQPQARFTQMVLETKAGLESGIIGSGHRFAGSRLAAQRSTAGWVGEAMGGLSYLEYIRGLAKRVEGDWDGVQVGGGCGWVGLLCVGWGGVGWEEGVGGGGGGAREGGRVSQSGCLVVGLPLPPRYLLWYSSHQAVHQQHLQPVTTLASCQHPLTPSTNTPPATHTHQQLTSCTHPPPPPHPPTQTGRPREDPLPPAAAPRHPHQRNRRRARAVRRGAPRVRPAGCAAVDQRQGGELGGARDEAGERSDRGTYAGAGAVCCVLWCVPCCPVLCCGVVCCAVG